MPEKVIDIPGVGQIAFPDYMTPDQIDAAASKLYKEANPQAKAEPERSWIDTAVDWLPAAGGIAGGIIGGAGGTVAGVGVGGVPGAVAGSAIGAAGGEGLRQAIQTARGVEQPRTTGQALKGMGEQAAYQGAGELVGGAVGKGMAAGMKAVAPGLMNSALKVTGKGAVRAAIKGETPPVIKTMLDEGINVTPGGMEKLNTLLLSTNQEIKDAIASVSGDVNPFKVTAKLGETAKAFGEQVNPSADLRAIGKAGNEFLSQHPKLTIQEAQALKTGTYKQLAGKYGELKGAEIEAQKALARGLKEEIANEVAGMNAGIRGRAGIAGGVDITAANAKEGAILEAREALGKRLAVSSRQNPMGLAGLAISHPMTFLTVLMDRSPAVKSLLARGMYSQAATVAKVTPQVLKAAVAAIVSTKTPAPDEP
jgi:hypothetical protein